MFDISVKNQTQTLADFLRKDPLWRAKNIEDSKLRLLLKGLAVESGRLESTLNEVLNNYNINNTEKFFEEWEKSLGIPSDCFTVVSDPDQRRANILTKLSALGVSTAAAFTALALTFGYTVNVYAGADYPNFAIDNPMLRENYTMVVEMDVSVQPNSFPYTFPMIFDTDNDTNIIICLFNKLVPSISTILYNYIVFP